MNAVAAAAGERPLETQSSLLALGQPPNPARNFPVALAPGAGGGALYANKWQLHRALSSCGGTAYF